MVQFLTILVVVIASGSGGYAVYATSEHEAGTLGLSTRDLGPGTRNPALGTRHLGPGTWDPGPGTRDFFCSSDGPPYYAVKLVSTKRLEGTRRARGVANVSFAPSPYGVHVSAEGTYVYDVSIEIEELHAPKSGRYVVWLTTPDLKKVTRVGSLDESRSITGRVDWNKFLVVVTLEESDTPDQERWKGPIALRGLSRSGFMHTMAGHGPFDQEPCAFYGYE